MAILNQDEQERIVHAVNLAENMTSGEIRLVVENVIGKDVSVYEKATQYFHKLNMHKTAQRNGVLLYLAIQDHQFAIIGDSGINSKVNADFWESTKEKMLVHFKQGDFVSGLVEGIREAGEQLRHYFPRGVDDINELPNDIHFGI